MGGLYEILLDDKKINNAASRIQAGFKGLRNRKLAKEIRKEKAKLEANEVKAKVNAKKYNNSKLNLFGHLNGLKLTKENLEKTHNLSNKENELVTLLTRLSPLQQKQKLRKRLLHLLEIEE